MVAAMIVAIFATPFGTYKLMGLVERAAFWVPVVSLSVLFGILGNVFAQLLLRDHSMYVVEATAAVFMTILFSPFVWAWALVLNPGMVVSAGGFLMFFAYVFVIAASVGVIRCALWAGEEEAEQVTQPERPREQHAPRLLRRVPVDLRGDVLRLSAKDHRVEVVTDRGTTDLRMRLSDAVAEMEPIDGLMTHRSHWVARHAVIEALRPDAQKAFVRLTNGDLVPISRTFRPDWMETGLLEPCKNGASATVASAQAVAQDPSEQQSRPRA